ncbi:MAG TPA: glycosyltransferase family 39 protein, partial [Candidatus Dormibacteraeota bacterium]|nr:glycosyltransferase family 39 protein [Candidatus Dormibacteraeota bacterium]
VRLYPERAGAGTRGPREAAADAAPVVPALDNPAAHYGPVTYGLFAVAIAAARGQGIVAQLMAARIIAVLLGMGGALATAWAARESGLRWSLALSAGAVVGYQPILSQQTAAVTTDAGLVCFSALAFALGVRWLARPRAWSGIGLGLAIGLALLSKPSAVFLVPLLLFLLWPVARRGQTADQRRRALALAAASGFLALVPFLVWNQLHPSVIAHTGPPGSLHEYARIVLGHRFAYLLGQVDSFWGNFGWFEQSLPQPVLAFCRALSLVMALLALAGVGLARGRARVAAVAGMLGFLGCAGIAFGFDLLLWRYQRGIGLQGRYFLPGFPLLVVAIMVGVQALGRRGRVPGAVFLAVVMVGLNGLSLLTLWNRFYLA